MAEPWPEATQQAWNDYGAAQEVVSRAQLTEIKARLEYGVASKAHKSAQIEAAEAYADLQSLLPDLPASVPGEWAYRADPAEEAEAPTPKQIQDTFVDPAHKARSGGKDYYTDAEGNSTILQPLGATGEMGIIRVVK